MSSLKLHKYEKWFSRFLFSFILLLIATVILLIVDKDSTLYQIVSIATKVLLVASIAMNLFISNKTKKWRQKGNQLTEEIGLKRLLVIEGHLPNRSQKIIEVHHKLGSITDGAVFGKRNRNEVVAEMKEELKEDFRKLAEWKKDNASVLLITSTHKSLAKIWEKSCIPNFYMKRSQQLFDPNVKMNLVEWLIASYSTTGKVDFHPPKEWDSYYFYLIQNDYMGD